MALPMTLIIIAGEIDLSVESMAGLASAILGFLWAAGVPLEVGIPVVLLVGALGGLLNGLLVARGGLPSLVVTLGTLALFRGLALIILGPRGVSDFPPGFTEIGFGHVPGTLDPVAVRHLPRARPDPRHRPPPDVGRAPGLRDRQEHGRGPLLRRPRRPRQDRPVRADRPDRRARRRHPDLAPVECPRRCRSGHDPHGRDRRPARRRQHLRRVRARSRASCWPSSSWRSCRTRFASPACRSRSRASPSGCS